MSIILLRTLALRSKIQAPSKYEGHSVGDVIKIDPGYLIIIYFTCSKISYTDEVLDMLGLTAEDQIPKPGKDPGRTFEVLDRLVIKGKWESKRSRGISQKKSKLALKAMDRFSNSPARLMDKNRKRR